MTRNRLTYLMPFAVLTLVFGTHPSLRADQFSSALSKVTAQHFGSLGTTQQPSGLTETILYNFQGSADGALPADLLQGPNGQLYGVTQQGGYTGSNCGYTGCGVVFQLTPSTGGWTQQVLHTFNYGDGANPWKSLIKDSHGALYGTTEWGGAYTRGVVFKMTPPANPGGAWAETTLYSFGQSSSDGWYPVGPLLMDSNGNLFGICSSDGGPARGTIFEVSPSTGGQWTEQVLYHFTSQSGSDPNSGLIVNAPGVNNPNEPTGALYGTTVLGGTSNYGTVYQLVPVQGGSWTLNVLHNFTGSGDGANPAAGLYMDARGNLFGTTAGGGASDNRGVVYEVSPSAQPAGSWTEKVIHTFSSQGGDGQVPLSVPVADSMGALYLSTQFGGSGSQGTVLKLVPVSPSLWAETILFNFNYSNGAYPEDVIRDSQGALYGATAYGGSRNKGIVFKLQ